MSHKFTLFVLKSKKVSILGHIMTKKNIRIYKSIRKTEKELVFFKVKIKNKPQIQSLPMEYYTLKELNMRSVSETST